MPHMPTMSKLSSALLLPLLVGCGSAYIPTPAYVTRFEGDALRACQVQLGMTVAELVSDCGRPDRIVPWIGHPDSERCLIYETKASALGAPAGAPFIAVCTGLGEGDGGFLAQDSRRRVVAVFGLRGHAQAEPIPVP